MNQRIIVLSLAVVLASVGCSKPAETAATPAATTGTADATTAKSTGQSTFMPNASAGIPVDSSTADAASLKNLVASLDVSPRKDPFSLTSKEKSFDLQQLAERLSAEGQTSTLMYEPPEEKDPTAEPEEAQPYRRLSGVLVGDSVLGILITPGKDGGDILRPGQMVPGTDFRVESIDEDKMVLSRQGNTNPKKVVVRLEQAPSAALSGFGGGGAAAGPQGAPGGAPGNSNGPADE